MGEEIIKMSRLSESFQAECTPGYYNNEGKPNLKSVQNGSYGAGPVKFLRSSRTGAQNPGRFGASLAVNQPMTLWR